ncbi:MAG TPA: hypothetical protein VNL71_16895, partial [Chloroflexota bacterium]|nr:hypothetical protein [Chloroflexota bacterium]
GFHGFRDPARFFYIGYFCLALLAAWGMGSLLERVHARRGAAAILLCLAALLEYWIAPVATPHIAVGTAIPPVYQWLERQPAHTPVLELPIGQENAVVWSEQALMTYYATYHWQPIVNGVGGYTPQGYEADAATLNRWPAASAERLLRQWGVRYVIWHPHWVGRPGPADSLRTPVAWRGADGTTAYTVR